MGLLCSAARCSFSELCLLGVVLRVLGVAVGVIVGRFCLFFFVEETRSHMDGLNTIVLCMLSSTMCILCICVILLRMFKYYYFAICLRCNFCKFHTNGAVSREIIGEIVRGNFMCLFEFSNRIYTSNFTNKKNYSLFK